MKNSPGEIILTIRFSIKVSCFASTIIYPTCLRPTVSSGDTTDYTARNHRCAGNSVVPCPVWWNSHDIFNLPMAEHATVTQTPSNKYQPKG